LAVEMRVRPGTFEGVLDSALGGRSIVNEVTGQNSAAGLVTIGDFARLTRLSAKALRIYDELGLVDHDSDGPLEAILGCPDEVAPDDAIGIRTEAAHDEAFATVTKAQWDYPAILAAYDAVASSPEATACPGSRLSCREVYLREPDDIGDDELICDIAFPLGESPSE